MGVVIRNGLLHFTGDPTYIVVRCSKTQWAFSERRCEGIFSGT